MRYPIWMKDDYFEYINGPRIDMDPAVVDISAEEILLFFNYFFDLPAIGRVTDLRLENGEITGEVEVFDREGPFCVESIKAFNLRVAGYYADVQKHSIEGGDLDLLIVTKARLKAATIVSLHLMPGFQPSGRDIHH